MNEKIKAILFKIIVDLKKMGWKVTPDWEITLQSEQYIPLSRAIDVEGNLGDHEWKDDIDTNVNLMIESDDNTTYFLNCSIDSSIQLNGGRLEDFSHRLHTDLDFTENDLDNAEKIYISAKKLDRLIKNYVESEYMNYIERYANDIIAYKNRNHDPDED